MVVGGDAHKKNIHTHNRHHKPGSNNFVFELLLTFFKNVFTADARDLTRLNASGSIMTTSSTLRMSRDTSSASSGDLGFTFSSPFTHTLHDKGRKCVWACV